MCDINSRSQRRKNLISSSFATLRQLCTTTRELCSCDFASFYSRNNSTNIRKVDNVISCGINLLSASVVENSDLFTLVVTSNESIEILDANTDFRFYNDPLVTGTKLRYIASAPACDREGQKVVCTIIVCDLKPRHEYSSNGILFLSYIASKVSEQISLQRELEAQELAELEDRIRLEKQMKDLLTKSYETQQQIQKIRRDHDSMLSWNNGVKPTDESDQLNQKSPSIPTQDLKNRNKSKVQLNSSNDATPTCKKAIFDLQLKCPSRQDILQSSPAIEDGISILQDPWKTKHDLKQAKTNEEALAVFQKLFQTIQWCKFDDDDNLTNSMNNAEIAGDKALELCFYHEAINFFAHCLLFAESCKMATKSKRIKVNKHLGDGYYEIGSMEKAAYYYSQAAVIAGYRTPSKYSSNTHVYGCLSSQWKRYTKQARPGSVLDKDMDDAEMNSYLAIALSRLQDFYSDPSESFIATYCCLAAMECAAKAGSLVRIIDVTPKDFDVGLIEGMYFRRVKVMSIKELSEVLERLPTIADI